MKIAACFVIFNEEDYIQYSMKSVYNHVDRVFVIFGHQWRGNPIPRDNTRNLVLSFPDPDKKLMVVDSGARNEAEQRNISLGLCKDHGMDYQLLIDGDEVYEPQGIENVKKRIIENPDADCLRSYWYTYWRSIYWRIDPPEGHTPIAIKIVPNIYFGNMRDPSGVTKNYVFSGEDNMVHHYSYAKSPEKIAQKISAFSHSHQILPNWYYDVFLKWEDNKAMQNIHPVWPTQYQKATKITREQLPIVMKNHPFAEMEVIK